MISRIVRVVKRDGFSVFCIRVLARLLRVDIGVQAVKNKAWGILEKNITSLLPMVRLRGCASIKMFGGQ